MDNILGSKCRPKVCNLLNDTSMSLTICERMDSLTISRKTCYCSVLSSLEELVGRVCGLFARAFSEAWKTGTDPSTFLLYKNFTAFKHTMIDMFCIVETAYATSDL